MDFALTLAPHLLNGLSLGFLFALIALGFMLIIGVMELINLAHGSLFALGAYVAMVVIAPSAPWWGALGKWYLAQPLALRYVLWWHRPLSQSWGCCWRSAFGAPTGRIPCTVCSSLSAPPW